MWNSGLSLAFLYPLLLLHLDYLPERGPPRERRRALLAPECLPPGSLLRGRAGLLPVGAPDCDSLSHTPCLPQFAVEKLILVCS